MDWNALENLKILTVDYKYPNKWNVTLANGEWISVEEFNLRIDRILESTP